MSVSIDPSYDSSDSSIELVTKTIDAALSMARELGARTVTLPALATGFGPLLIQDFAAALQQALAQDWKPLETLKVMLKHEHEAEIVRTFLKIGQ